MRRPAYTSAVLAKAMVGTMRFLPYRLRLVVARSRTASRIASRLLRDSAPEVVDVRGGPLAGARLELDLSREKAFLVGSHEPRIRRLLEELARPGMTAWDVGAHIGFFALVLARRCERVVAVEANPENARRLRRNVELNDAAVEVVEAAATDSTGVVELLRGPLSGTHRLAGTVGPRWKHDADETRTTVEATTFDELAVRFGTPDLIKIDIEGAEVAALRGATDVLREHPTIVCETHGAEIRATVEQILHDAGYRNIEAVDDDHLVATK